MFRKTLKYLVVVLGSYLLLTCQREGTPEKPVAKVGEEQLFESDLAKIIPNGLSEGDSIIMAHDYINKWIKQELLIQKANENLTNEQKDVSDELKEYRNSLIIYKYKNELMKQRMDTTVSAEQIQDYYNANLSSFNLSRDIVKAIYIKVPIDISNPQLLKKLVDDTSEEGLNDLREYCLQYAKAFDIFINRWVDFKLLQKNVPLEIENAGRFLSGNSLFELNDSNYYYLVSIHDYKLKNQQAPIEFVENNIKNLLLNQRKIKFLNQIEENIYEEGIRLNKFKIYNTETDETK